MNHASLRLRFAGLRSLLVAGRPSAIAGAARSAADALILDVEETSSARMRACLERARRLAPARPLLVRLGAPELPRFEGDLDAIMAGRPDALVLPECRSGAAVQQLGAKLAVREAELGSEVGATAIVAQANAAGLLALTSFAAASPRLVALAWETPPAGRDGGVDHPVDALAQSLVLLGARAAGVAAFDLDLASDASSVASASRHARWMGFAGRITREAARVETINAAFGPAPAVGRG